jgi:hypothetical protein
VLSIKFYCLASLHFNAPSELELCSIQTKEKCPKGKWYCAVRQNQPERESQKKKCKKRTGKAFLDPLQGILHDILHGWTPEIASTSCSGKARQISIPLMIFDSRKTWSLKTWNIRSFKFKGYFNHIHFPFFFLVFIFLWKKLKLVCISYIRVSA